MASITFNSQKLRDKIKACWIGKNIGGTLGGPYEGTRDVLNVQGFVTEAGKPLPNDDLDLQLIWLRAIDELGPEMVDEKVLGEYWITYVGPHWGEYGHAMSNMREGILPPMSGHVYNDKWKHSNGAWIRTEIWACLFPGCPERAVRYAYYDACVDHGHHEGTFAAMFIAAMESAAFVYNDLQLLLKIGLSKIPADCRVAKAVRLVIEEHSKGTPWLDVRNMLVKQSEDIGWFQAPANVAFVVLGLLYGECDFKKSMLTAVNCGDDTDCTAATLGSLLGIMYGTEGIPDDWKQHVGEEIITFCNLNGHGPWPPNCETLTQWIMNLLPLTLRDTQYESLHYRNLTYVVPWLWAKLGTEDDFSQITPDVYMGDGFAKDTFSRSPYSIYQWGPFCEAWVELDRAPDIAPNESISGKITVKNMLMRQTRHYRVRWLLPEGWHASGRLNISTTPGDEGNDPVTFVLTAPEKVDPSNRIVLEISVVGRPTCLYIPITLIG